MFYNQKFAEISYNAKEMFIFSLEYVCNDNFPLLSQVLMSYYLDFLLLLLKFKTHSAILNCISM